MWNELIALLSEIVALYRVILDISHSKKKALVAAQIEELDALTKREEGIILRIGKIESDREKLIIELAGLYTLSPQELTLKKAGELAGGEIAEKLQKVETELSDLVNKLAPINKTNTELIQQSLNYVNYNLNLLTQGQASPNYAAKGQGESQRPRTVIDAKI